MGDYKNPILKPEAAEVVKKYGEMSLSGIVYPTPTNQCWPGGVPYDLWNTQMQMLQEPNAITILYTWDPIVRHVRMNAPHLSPMKPSLLGDSVGRYVGDTLVIDTVGIKPGPFAMVDMYGTPFSPALHVIERYRLIDFAEAKEATERDEKDNLRLPDFRNDAGVAIDHDYKGKQLQLEFTVEDAGVFSMPWKATITYLRAANQWREYVCAENVRRTGAAGDTETKVPMALKPDF